MRQPWAVLTNRVALENQIAGEYLTATCVLVPNPHTESPTVVAVVVIVDEEYQAAIGRNGSGQLTADQDWLHSYLKWPDECAILDRQSIGRNRSDRWPPDTPHQR
jgi:hypothetical protein